MKGIYSTQCLFIVLIFPFLAVGQAPQRQVLYLSPPANPGGTAGGQYLIAPPPWKSGAQYYGTTGSTSHANYVLANNCGDGGPLYAYQNTAGDISFASVAPGSAGTGCTAGGTTTDGSGTWTNLKIGAISLAGSTLNISGNSFAFTLIPATINTTGIGLTTGAEMWFGGLVEGSDTCLNAASGNVSSTIGAHNFTIVISGTGCTNASNASVSAGYVYIGSNFKQMSIDDFFHYQLTVGNATGIKLELNWKNSGCDTGTTAPHYVKNCMDTTFTAYTGDSAWPKNAQIAFDIAHQNSSGNANNATPPYVAATSWANTACDARPWQPGANYVFGMCVKDNTTNCSGGPCYEQMSNTGSAVTCVSSPTGSAPSGGWTAGAPPRTTTEGAGTGPCKWVSSAAAPPQRFVCGPTSPTISKYAGDPTMQAITNSNGSTLYTIWDFNTAGAYATAHLLTVPSETDMVSCFPVPGDWPYMYAVEQFDAAYLAYRATATAPPISALAYATVGVTENGQNLPSNAIMQTSANYLNNGVTTSSPPNQWTQFWCGNTSTVGAGVSTQYYVNDYNIMVNNPAWMGKLQIGAQGSASPTETLDPTALSDACAYQAVQQGLGLTFEGATAADNATCPGAVAGDWCHIASTYYNVPNMSMQAVAPGQCNGTGSGRADQQLQNWLNYPPDCRTFLHRLGDARHKQLLVRDLWYGLRSSCVGVSEWLRLENCYAAVCTSRNSHGHRPG